MTFAPSTLSVEPAQRFIHLADDGTTVDADSEAVAVIQDNQTGLQWGAKPLLDGHNLDHAEALKAASECRLLGAEDWQLMAVEEFDTVKDLTRYEPAVNPVLHRWPFYGWAWTRNDVADPDCSDSAWYVYLYHGYSNFYGRYNQGVALVCRPVPGVVSSPVSHRPFGLR